MENPIDFLKPPIAVVGLGLSGDAACRLLLRSRVNKKNLIRFDERAGAGEYSDPALLMAERKPQTLVVSPGVPLAKDWIRDFRELGGEITSELALAALFLSGERVIGVTGSVGKSTTVSLLEAGLRAFSPHSFVGGNIGRPLADYVCELLEGRRPPAPWIVLELSSYQLENCGSLQCELSCISYLTGNHLDRYSSRDEYYETKWSIARRSSRALILNRNGGDLQRFMKGRKCGAQLLWTDQSDEELSGYHFEEAMLLGAHNQDNLALAAKIAREAGWPPEAFEAMRRFPGLPHRMENLGVRGKVRFVNDSKATTMESVKTATLGLYERMDRRSGLVLLLGGRDKKLPWGELAVLSKIPNLRPVFFGECAELARSQSGLSGECYPRLKDALSALHSYVRPGDTVLLSPGGTSLDEFRSFEERGAFFADTVRAQYQNEHLKG